MLYHHAMMLLHRPFISDSSTMSFDAGDVCSNSASEFNRLLILYRRRYSLRHINVQGVHMTMTAGVIHAYDSCVYSGTRGKSAQDNLLVCVQALGEMGHSFAGGVRGLEVLTSLRRVWQTQKFCPSGTKRHRSMSSST